jgi:hypothetical protein
MSRYRPQYRFIRPECAANSCHLRHQGTKQTSSIEPSARLGRHAYFVLVCVGGFCDAQDYVREAFVQFRTIGFFLKKVAFERKQAPESMDESAGPTLPSALLYVAGRPRVHLLLWTREAEETWAVNHAMAHIFPSPLHPYGRSANRSSAHLRVMSGYALTYINHRKG